MAIIGIDGREGRGEVSISWLARVVCERTGVISLREREGVKRKYHNH